MLAFLYCGEFVKNSIAHHNPLQESMPYKSVSTVYSRNDDVPSFFLFDKKNQRHYLIFSTKVSPLLINVTLLPPAYVLQGKVIFILGNVCLFTIGGVGTPSQVGGNPIPGWVGVPQVPPHDWMGYAPRPEVGTLTYLRWGTSPTPQTWDGYPPDLRWGTPETWDGIPPRPEMGYPPS